MLTITILVRFAVPAEAGKGIAYELLRVKGQRLDRVATWLLLQSHWLSAEVYPTCLRDTVTHVIGVPSFFVFAQPWSSPQRRLRKQIPLHPAVFVEPKETPRNYFADLNCRSLQDQGKILHQSAGHVLKE